MKKEVTDIKKERLMKIENNPEHKEHNSKIEKEVKMSKTFENKILEDVILKQLLKLLVIRFNEVLVANKVLEEFIL